MFRLFSILLTALAWILPVPAFAEPENAEIRHMCISKDFYLPGNNFNLLPSHAYTLELPNGNTLILKSKQLIEYKNLQPGNNRYIFTDRDTDSNKDKISIFEILGLSRVYIEAETLKIHKGESLTLKASDGHENYMWYENGVEVTNSDNKQTIEIMPLEDSIYTIEATNGDCLTSSSIKITVDANVKKRRLMINIMFGTESSTFSGSKDYLGEVTNEVNDKETRFSAFMNFYGINGVHQLSNTQFLSGEVRLGGANLEQEKMQTFDKEVMREVQSIDILWAYEHYKHYPERKGDFSGKLLSEH